MFDTPVTIVGNVLTAPEWRRTVNTGTPLVTFKVASTARRWDRDRNAWVDGNCLRVRVACWRKLAENAALSLQLGDPVILLGRIYTRDWTDGEGNHRVSYEMDAVSVGHDLARGIDKFARRRAAGSTDMVDDAATAAAIGGEMTEAMEGPERPTDLPPDHVLFDEFEVQVEEPIPPAAEPDLVTEPDLPVEPRDPEPVLAGAGSPAGGRTRGGRSRAGGVEARA